MLEKIRGFIQKTFGRAPAKGSMVVVWTFAIIVIFEVIAYNAGWFYNWYRTQSADTPEMRLFLVTVVCGGLITAAGFVGRAFVDKNENDEPDIWEEERKDKHE